MVEENFDKKTIFNVLLCLCVCLFYTTNNQKYLINQLKKCVLIKFIKAADSDVQAHKIVEEKKKKKQNR